MRLTLHLTEKVLLRFSYSSSDQTANGFLDWVEIAYPRGLVTNNGEFAFFTDTALAGVCEYNINGFSGTVYAFDVTDRGRPQLVTNVAPSGSICGIRELMPDDSYARRYFVSSRIKSASLTKIPDLTLQRPCVEG